jgi:two-component system, LuxR family, response regulator FixJ
MAGNSLEIARHVPPGTMGDRAICMTSSEKSDSEVVCLVDDDLSVLKSIGRLLASEGLSVRAFNEPKSFLAQVKTNTVPVVVLDIWMEQMTGLEVQEQLRILSPNTRVIIITGRCDPAAYSAAMRAGAAGFFIKPFDDEEFLTAVRMALRLWIERL